MATFSESALILAGFTLAHAAWDLSAADPGEAIAPLAMLETRERHRRLVRFEDADQDAAAARAREALFEATARGHAWAFVRESTWRPSGDEQQVLVLEFWAHGMDAPATILQPFVSRAADRAFRLVGPPALATADLIVTEGDVRETLDVLDTGIQSHEVAAKYWTRWHGDEAA